MPRPIRMRPAIIYNAKGLTNDHLYLGTLGRLDAIKILCFACSLQASLHQPKILITRLSSEQKREFLEEYPSMLTLLTMICRRYPSVRIRLNSTLDAYYPSYRYFTRTHTIVFDDSDDVEV